MLPPRGSPKRHPSAIRTPRPRGKRGSLRSVGKFFSRCGKGWQTTRRADRARANGAARSPASVQQCARAPHAVPPRRRPGRARAARGVDVTRFSEFAERFHHHFSIDPNRRVTLGIPGDLGSLPDPSLAHAASVASEAERLLSELGGIDPGTLDFEQRLDSKLARLMLEAEVHALTHRFNDRLRLEQ